MEAAEETTLTGTEFTDAMQPPAVAPPEAAPAPEAVDTPVAPAQEAVETPTDPEQAEGPNTASMLRNAARKMGIEIQDEDSVEELALIALQNLHAVRQAQKQYQPPAPEAVAPVQADPNKWDPDSYFDQKWGVQWSPDFDQAISSGIVVTDPETNTYVAKPGYEAVAAPILPRLNDAYRQVSQKWAGLTKGNLFKEVYNVTKDPILREVERLVDERLSRVQQQTVTQSVVEKFEQDNSSWMYSQDPVTKELLPTPEGSRMIRAVQALYAQGETDPRRAIQDALEITGLSERTKPKQAAAPVQAPTAVSSQSPQQSFLERAREANAYSPSASGPGSDPGNQVVSEDDLNRLFVRSFQGSR